MFNEINKLNESNRLNDTNELYEIDKPYKSNMHIRINGLSNKTYISGQINIDSASQDSVGIAQWGSNNQTFISGTVKASGQVLSFTSNPVSEKNALLNFKGSGNEFVPNEGAIIIGQIGAPNRIF